MMYIATIALLISAVVIPGSLGSKKKPTNECYEKCKEKGFTCNDLSTFKLEQRQPCSFTCYCEDYSSYYSVEEGAVCGENYKCYRGSCRYSPENIDCSYFGECYFPIMTYGNCMFRCVNKKGCGVYLVNVDDGTTCKKGNCCNRGSCYAGKCLTKGGCKDRYQRRSYYDEY